MNIIQKNSKDNNPLDYPLNIIDNLYVGINNKLNSPRNSNFVEFRWYRDTYFAILQPSLGLKIFFLKLLSLGLEINLGITTLLLKKDRTKLEYIGNISKLN